MLKILTKFFSTFLIIISIIFFLYIFYKSEIFWSSSKRNYYFIYYVISIFLFIFSIITFFISKKFKEYLIISIISLIVSLYLFETYLFFKHSNTNTQFSKEMIYEKNQGNKWDKRTKIQVYEDLNKKYDNVSLSIAPIRYSKIKNISILPLSGVSNSMTINCNENGYYSIYQSDRYGFNNPDEQWDNKEIEYLLVGDSFSLGSCVNRPNDLASVLRNISKKTSINLGQSGNGPIIEYALLREYLPLNTNKILWFYYEGNDLGNLKEEKGNKILVNYLNDLNFTQNLKFRQKEINELSASIIEKEKEHFIIDKIDREQERLSQTLKYRLIKFIKIYNTRNLIRLSLDNSHNSYKTTKFFEQFKKILNLTKKLSETNQSILYFVYLPEYQRYNSEYKNYEFEIIKKIADELDIVFIDIDKEVFQKETNPLKLFPFEEKGHYNVEGYKKIGKAIFDITKD